MALFRRKKTVAAEVTEVELEDNDVEATEQEGQPTSEDSNAPEEPDQRAGGPYDITELNDDGVRIDLGSLRVPGVDGMKLRFEVAQGTEIPVGVSLAVGKSSLLINAFAAPRSEGIWAEVREEIVASAKSQGGSADEVPGPFGTEIKARLPVRTEKNSGLRPVRFLGVDGPRWFLRGVMSGEAAINPEAAVILEALFADVVVVRDDQPRAPREPLPLTLPKAGDGRVKRDGAQNEEAATEDQTEESKRPSLSLPERGPEITEVH